MHCKSCFGCALGWASAKPEGQRPLDEKAATPGAPGYTGVGLPVTSHQLARRRRQTAKGATASALPPTRQRRCRCRPPWPTVIGRRRRVSAAG